jgi:predicted metal-dependent hydrolase
MEIVISDIKIEVTFKDIKNVHLSVHPPFGNVTLSSPAEHSIEKIRTYLITKITWIRKQQKKILEQDRESSHEFISRESHYFLGKRYLMKITESVQPSIKLHHDIIELFSPKTYTADQKEKQLYNWYKKELIVVLGKYTLFYCKKMNVTFDNYHIRKMKTKWGSCNSDKNIINFNIELVKKPVECIEYIVVHEMVHLLVRNHNQDFIILMDKFLPNWRSLKQRLNELPTTFNY